MKYIETEFSKELSALMFKHRKTFTSDKSGIYITDDDGIVKVLVGEAETASEDSRSKLFFVLSC